MAEILQGVAAVLWPLLVIALVVFCGPALKNIIASAEKREFIVKIGDKTLTFKEYDEQRRKVAMDTQKMIIEMQSEIAALKSRLEGGAGIPEAAMMEEEPAARKRKAQSVSILWVDDKPENNLYIVQQLTDVGLAVDQAVSTADGLARFSRGGYDLVISDMGREEAKEYNERAGFDLIEKIRKLGAEVPIIIYTNGNAARRYQAEAEAAGALDITASSVALFEAIMRALIVEDVDDRLA